jgi:methionine--tRNA ligase beta chain
MITFEEFKKMEIKIGEILSVEKVPETDKLLKLSVDFKEESPRQIVSGISAYFPNEKMLVGKKCAFVTNLEPRTIRGLESNGMILAVSGESDGQEFFSLVETTQNVLPGSVVK